MEGHGQRADIVGDWPDAKVVRTVKEVLGQSRNGSAIELIPSLSRVDWGEWQYQATVRVCHGFNRRNPRRLVVILLSGHSLGGAGSLGNIGAKLGANQLVYRSQKAIKLLFEYRVAGASVLGVVQEDIEYVRVGQTHVYKKRPGWLGLSVSCS